MSIEEHGGKYYLRTSTGKYFELRSPQDTHKAIVEAESGKRSLLLGPGTDLPLANGPWPRLIYNAQNNQVDVNYGRDGFIPNPQRIRSLLRDIKEMKKE